MTMREMTGQAITSGAQGGRACGRTDDQFPQGSGGFGGGGGGCATGGGGAGFEGILLYKSVGTSRRKWRVAHVPTFYF